MSITLHVQAETLRNEIRALRRSLLWCQEEWHAISVVLRERLTNTYHAAFGDIEADIQRLALEHAELFRRVEILTIKHDRGEVITAAIVEHVHHIVDREYRRFRERIRQAAQEDALVKPVDSDQGLDEEVVHLFRVVAKRLHPDMNGGQANDDLWRRARRAYEGGDLRTLKAIEEGTAIGDTLDDDDIETLTLIAERLTGRLAAEQKKLARLRTEEPFTLEHVLDDELWKHLHRTTLEHQRNAWRRAIDQARERYAELTSGIGDAQAVPRRADRDDDTKTANNDDFMESTYFGFR